MYKFERQKILKLAQFDFKKAMFNNSITKNHVNIFKDFWTF